MPTRTTPAGLGWLLALVMGVISCGLAGCSSTKKQGGDEQTALMDTFRGGRYVDRERAMAGLLTSADMKEQKGGIYEVRSGFEMAGPAAAGGSANVGRREYSGGGQGVKSQAFRGGDLEFRSQAFDGRELSSGMGRESYGGLGESRMANREARAGSSAMGGQEAYGVLREGSRASSADALASPLERSAQRSQERNVRPVIVEDRSAGGGSMSESEVRSFLGKD